VEIGYSGAARRRIATLDALKFLVGCLTGRLVAACGYRRCTTET
jgi:hypothetical protein